MPKTLKLELHLDSAELENCYCKAHDPVKRSHYQIVWLISEGRTTRQIMEATGYSRDWIQQLARRYNADGPRALGDRRRRNLGARERALLDPDQRWELAEALRKPHENGGMWNSRMVAERIEKKPARRRAKWERARGNASGT